MSDTQVTRKSGQEPFKSGNHELSLRLLAFWQWASSDLLGNTQRGVLAEFIVAHALGCDQGTRQEWDAYDIKTTNGIRVEVKSAAYVQSWHQDKPSSINFSIPPTLGWDASTNVYAESRFRQADVYVFCVLKHQNKATIDPLNLDQWDFYVLPTNILNERVGDQKTITLGSLLRLEPISTDFDGLKQSINSTITP